MQNLLIGKIVEYSITKEETSIGLVMGVESIQKDVNSQSIITGYVVEDQTSKLLKHVAYWRVIRVIDTNIRLNNTHNTDHSNDLKKVDYDDDLPF